MKKTALHRTVWYVKDSGHKVFALVMKDHGDGTVDLRISSAAQPVVDKTRVRFGRERGQCWIAFSKLERSRCNEE